MQRRGLALFGFPGRPPGTAVLDRRARALRDEMLSRPLVWPGGQAGC
jgi:hypothetical protein